MQYQEVKLINDAERYQYQLIDRMAKNPKATPADIDMCKYILHIIQANIVFNRLEAVNKQLKEESKTL